MQIIISPAKKMRVDNDDIGAARLPVFLTKTEELLTVLRASASDIRVMKRKPHLYHATLDTVML